MLWLLQFMQEQAISLDEVDQNGNTAVHVAAQYGHLTCIQVRSEQRAATFSLTQGFRRRQAAFSSVSVCFQLTSCRQSLQHSVNVT